MSEHKINDELDQLLVDPLKTEEYLTNEKEEPLSVRQILKTSLVNYTDPQNDTPEQKTKRWDLFLKIQDCNLNDLESEEVSEIKNCVGNMFATSIYGQISKILEGKQPFKNE